MRISDAKLTRPLLITVDGPAEMDSEYYSCQSWGDLITSIEEECQTWTSHNKALTTERYLTEYAVTLLQTSHMSPAIDSMTVTLFGYTYTITAGKHGLI